jgi:hypothetical protein
VTQANAVRVVVAMVLWAVLMVGVVWAAGWLVHVGVDLFMSGWDAWS